MIPDLGAYAVEVLAAYSVSIALLIGLVAMSLLRARKLRRKLVEVEQRREERR